MGASDLGALKNPLSRGGFCFFQVRGDANHLRGRRWRGPGGFSLLSNELCPTSGAGSSGDGGWGQTAGHAASWRVGLPSAVHENPEGEDIASRPDRTHHRIRFPRCAASRRAVPGG